MDRKDRHIYAIYHLAKMSQVLRSDTKAVANGCIFRGKLFKMFGISKYKQGHFGLPHLDGVRVCQLKTRN